MAKVNGQNTQETCADGTPKRDAWRYVVVVFLAVVWLWRVKLTRFGQNPAMAIACDMVSLGLPVLILWYGARRLFRQLKTTGSSSARNLTFGTIFAAISLRSFYGLVDARDQYRHMATQAGVFYATMAAFLFWLAYRKRTTVAK
jgi:hypothetical protein